MTNNLRKRGGRYYFRRRVPLDLQSQLGTAELSYSLGTTDYSVAKVLAVAETAKHDAAWLAMRAKRSRPIDSGIANALIVADEWEREYAAHPEHHDSMNEGLRQARAATDQLLDASGLPSSSQLAHLAGTGGYALDDQPPPEKAARVSGSGHPNTFDGNIGPHDKTLRDVIPSWAARNAPKANAVRRTEKALDLFEQAVGAIPLRMLSKAHGATFVRFLLDTETRGFGRKTAANHAACITALVNVATKDDLIDRNPLDLTFDKTVGAERRAPWTDAELRMMFSSPLFADEMAAVEHWQGVTPADGRALLLLLQHTGARIGEIAQLRRGDFLIQDGITVIRITARAGTVKTRESERTVPLAGHLLADLWFGAWLAKVIDGTHPSAPAMPSMAGRARGPADTAVQWFQQFRAFVGLPAGALNGAHKFRHWIRSALAGKDVGDATADAITGHAAQGSSGRVDYTKISLPVMLAALNRVTFPDIPAPRLSTE